MGRSSSAFTKVMPVHTPARTSSAAGSPRKSIVARLRLRASSVLAMQPLNPFAPRRRRRRRRRSATTDQIVSTQHASALSAVSMRSDDYEHEARTLRVLETAKKKHATLKTVNGDDTTVDSQATARVSSRVTSRHQRATAEYLVQLSAFFFACDYDEDGALSKDELQIVMEILAETKALSETKTNTTTTTRQPSRKNRSSRRAFGDDAPRAAPRAILFEDDETFETEGQDPRVAVTLEQFIERLGHRLYAEHVELPSVEFVRRCQRLKLGFRRCDSNGDNVMSVQELEIALQKLDLVVADDDLAQLVHTLDANGDGTIEWSEMVRAAWMNAQLGPARNRNSVLLLDALADVPAAAIRRPRYFRGAASTTSVVHAPDAPGHDRTHKKKTNKTPPHVRKPSWLLRAALKMHLVLPQQDAARVDVPDPEVTAHARGPSKSRVERLGVRILTRISMQQVQSMKRAPRTNGGNGGRRTATAAATPSPARIYPSAHEAGGPTSGATGLLPSSPAATARVSTTVTRTKLTAAMRRRVVRIERIATVLAALIGVACGLVSIRFESLVPRTPSVDPHEHQRDTLFSGDAVYYVYLVAINLGVSLLEVHLLYFTSVVCAFRMTVATRLTLYPQDAEREFLTRAIARAALQVGLRKDTLFGMDPMKGAPRVVLLCSLLVVRSKRSILKFLLKLFIGRVLWRAAAKTMLSVVVLPLNAVLNAWTLRAVMRQCRVTILGPPCITALLEEFFARQELKLLPYQRVDYLRVLGCALVSKRCVHPNVEIVIHQVRHQWVTPVAWPVGDGCSCVLCPDTPCELHALDDMDRFFASLLLDASRLSPAAAAAPLCAVLDVDHQRNMFFFLILALVVNGELTLADRRFFLRACAVAQVQCDWAAVRKLKQDFFNGDGLRLDAIFALIVLRPRGVRHVGALDAASSATEMDERSDATQSVAAVTTPWLDALLYVRDRVASLLVV